MGTFATLAGSVLLALAGTNALVDPFNVLGLNRIGIYASNERLTKPTLLANADYDTIVIGSSKVASIYPSNFVGVHGFNASFGAALPEEMAWFLERYTRPGQTVLLGLDFYMTNEREFNFQQRDPFAAANRPGAIAYLFDKNVFRLSIESLVAHFWHGYPPAILHEGTRNQVPDWSKHNALKGPDYERVLNTLRDNHYRDVRYSEKRLAVLRDLKQKMAERGVKLIVFINPLHREVRALIKELAEEPFQRFRRDVRAIFPAAYDLTGDEWSSPEFYFRHDPYHYQPGVGACFINQMLAGRTVIETPAVRPDCLPTVFPSV